MVLEKSYGQFWKHAEMGSRDAETSTGSGPLSGRCVLGAFEASALCGSGHIK